MPEEYIKNARGVRSRIVEDRALVCHDALGDGVGEAGGLFKARDELRRLPLRHREIVQPEVSAVDRRCAGDLPFVVAQMAEGRQHQGQKVLLRIRRALHDEIAPREAPHRPPVDHPVFPLRIIAQKRRHHVLDRVHRVRMDRRLGVRELHADVVCGHRLGAERIRAGDVDAGLDERVVDLERGNEVHDK